VVVVVIGLFDYDNDNDARPQRLPRLGGYAMRTLRDRRQHISSDRTRWTLPRGVHTLTMQLDGGD
ncbi:hypothetical protein, partial [uncultured Thiodictyon sp.]|uniref:hypothetical protein n=1 Tax=uncultured Thiodictyon sp. TaxID=1846217 RepID=UPI0025D55D85